MTLTVIGGVFQIGQAIFWLEANVSLSVFYVSMTIIWVVISGLLMTDASKSHFKKNGR